MPRSATFKVVIRGRRKREIVSISSLTSTFRFVSFRFLSSRHIRGQSAVPRRSSDVCFHPKTTFCTAAPASKDQFPPTTHNPSRRSTLPPKYEPITSIVLPLFHNLSQPDPSIPSHNSSTITPHVTTKINRQPHFFPNQTANQTSRDHHLAVSCMTLH